MSPEVSSGNESDLKTGPVRALIGAEEHIASHHNVVSPGVLYKISLLVTLGEELSSIKPSTMPDTYWITLQARLMRERAAVTG